MSDDFEKQLKLLEQMIPKLPVCEKEYRLYYNETTGEPLFFSMEKLPGCYIIVSEQDYTEAAINYIQVINKQIVRKNLMNDTKNRLVPSNTGTDTLPNDIQFVVDQDYTGSVSSWKLDE